MTSLRGNIKKLHGYVRVSTDTQAEKGYGLEDQKKGITDFAKKNEYTLVDIFIDAGCSGAKEDLQADIAEDALEERGALLDMLDRLSEIDAVIVLNTSRLWRDDGPKFFIQRALKRKHIDIISVEQPTYTLYDNSPSNKFVNTIIEAVDVLDRDSIRIKLARGRTTKASHGHKPAGLTPYGYQYATDRKSIVLHPDEAAVIKLIFRLAQCGSSLQKIADELNRAGKRTRRGNLWSKSGLHAICRNDFYIGVVTHKKEKIPGQHKAIISKVQFGKVQSQLKQHRKILV